MDLNDLPNRPFFINLSSGRVVGLKFGDLGLDEAIKLEKDLPVCKSILLDCDLVEGQLKIFIDLVIGISFSCCLVVGDDDGP